MEAKLYEIIGRLYTDIVGGQQMLSHLQAVVQQKDEEIKKLTGQLIDKKENPNERTPESESSK